MAQCLTPFYVKNNRYGIDAEQISKIPVPCGRCPTCVERRTNQWVLRLTEQDKVSQSSYFFTLTYSNENVPRTKNGFLTLRKSDVQKFFKRLRRHHKGPPIKYYVVGEYGTDTRRPHYHAIIFNTDPLSVQLAWGLGESRKPGPLNSNTIAYCCKYMAKETVHRKKHGRDDRDPEFSLCSQGLGKNYVSARSGWHKDDINRNYAIMPGGVKVPLPRYFKEKLYDENTRRKQALTAKLLDAEKEEKRRNEYIERTNDYTWDGYAAYRKECLNHTLGTYYQAQEKNRKKL